MNGIIFYILTCSSAFLLVDSFQLPKPQTSKTTKHLYSKLIKLQSIQTTTTTTTSLYAKKKKKRATRTSIGNRTKSASGFGGAATEPCPCGSSLGYMKCCGRLHKNEEEYANASAKEVVLARYSAYAKREIDFIIGSTHPLNKGFMTDIEHWKETIKMNCYDNFELTKCEIHDETYEGEGEDRVAKVKFTANMVQIDSKEKTSFTETSTFERAGKHIRRGAWLYRQGDIEPVVTDTDEVKEEDEVKKEEGVTS